jgi:hypothetical protein
MKTLPAHYLDYRTQQLIDDANADIQHHTQQMRAVKDQAQTEKELRLFYDQLEALDKPVAAHLRPDEKETLSNYYKTKIRQNLNRLDVFVNGLADTARALKKNVQFERISQ